jgi:hypothetical protein
MWVQEQEDVEAVMVHLRGDARIGPMVSILGDAESSLVDAES